MLTSDSTRVMSGMVLAACTLLVFSKTVHAEETIDSLLSMTHQQENVSPVELCSDDTFLRRVSLDLIGRIPTRSELQQFRRNPDRSRKIEQLLASDEFPRFWSDVWTASLIGYASEEFPINREPFRIWMEEQIAQDRPYDKIVRDLIAAEGDSAFDGPVNFLLRHQDEPVVKVSRMFLGIRLDCARCHDHPFARWKREDFDRFNQFFESVEIEELSEGNLRLYEISAHAEDDELPRFLTGARPRTHRWRDELALHLTSCLPFARTFANRVWYQLLGRGIVDPPDDFDAGETASNELLEHLTQFVRTHDYQFKPLIRLICHSQAYQRASGYTENSEASSSLFASYAPKPLTLEQQWNSLGVILGPVSLERAREQFLVEIDESEFDTDYSQTWNYRETVQEMMQHLSQPVRLNGQTTHSLYEIILSRAPTQREAQLCSGRIASQITFALLHSNEFRFNH